MRRDPIVRTLGNGTAFRTFPHRSVITPSLDPRILERVREDGEGWGVPRCPDLGPRKGNSALALSSLVGSSKEGPRPGPPYPATGSRWGGWGCGGGREGGRADSPPAASSAAGIFFL